jgi:energy-coupling factor transporter ATP-binding protein EcfA2
MVRGVCDRLIARRTLSPLDRVKSERIARDALLGSLVRDLGTRAGKAFIRIAGHGGCGKTTALTMLAARLATAHGGRVLVLTFHQTLCGDIRAIVDTMREAQGIAETKLSVQTATSFLLGLLEVVAEVPYTDKGTPEYARLDEAYESAAQLLDDGPGGATVASVIRSDPGRFQWDHVLIDEAQDWTDAERALLCAVYGHHRLIIADGLSQLVRRQIPCDWLASIPSEEREVRVLDDSLRMTHNVAQFANAFAQAAGLADWSVVPRRDLPGGRVVIVEGELEERLPLLMAMGDAASRGNARPIDTLICVPPTEVEVGDDGVRRSRAGQELAGVNLQVWDACDASLRGVPPTGTDSWRVVQYDSCRGLEGWATLLFALDDLFANKLKHPNLHASDGAIAPDLIARRWLMIPLTRAVQLLIVHVRDPESRVAAMLREAASAMPAGVVEWYASHEAARAIAPSDADVPSAASNARVH